MSWTKTTENDMVVAKEMNVTLPNATTGYSSEIDFLKVDPDKTNQYVTLIITASAVSGTNLDIILYGADSPGGTKYQLKDAIVADITDTTPAVAIVDLNAYPAPYYYIGWTADSDESSNTIDVKFLVP